MNSAKKKFRSVLLFGPPGVGKGTQGGVLGNIPGFFHLAVGDVFRSIDINSPIGKKVYAYSSKGELVPDELTIEIWKKALNAYVSLSRYKPWEDLLVLDGIPRNLNQAELVESDLDILSVIHLACSDQEDMVHRIKRRAIRETGATTPTRRLFAIVLTCTTRHPCRSLSITQMKSSRPLMPMDHPWRYYVGFSMPSSRRKISVSRRTGNQQVTQRVR